MLCLAMGLGACAGPSTERHLAPIFTQLSLAGGDTEVEVAGGAVQVRYNGDTGELDYWAVRPLVSWRKLGPERSFSWILPPLGTRRVEPHQTITQILPITRYAGNGTPRRTNHLVVPDPAGHLLVEGRDGRVTRTWFPFGGVMEHFLSFDRAEFALFPLYLHTQRNGRDTVHFLFPFFSVTSGNGGPSWRVWPLATHNKFEGRYDRWSVLWPLFTWQGNNLSGPEEYQQHGWMFWPFYGQSKRGPARSWSALWPLFGYAKDPRTGFWAWDGPWPFVVLQGGDPARAERRRFWPFYSYYKGDGLTSRYFLWPLFNLRREETSAYTKHTRYLFPFWHGYTRTSKDTGLETTWRKLWPIFRHYHNREDQVVIRAFPALNPFWRLDFVDEHYSWMWELWTEERYFERYRQRSWLGMWRREKDLDEDRRSLVGLWARRNYLLGGVPTTETSMLFGLIRWRSQEGKSSSMMRAAFPGPGWPLLRTPARLENMEGAVPARPRTP
ncbi:MAG: hypothetical protein R3E96_03055 [Planctomycetota bacterium]